MSFYTAKSNVFFEKQIVARKVNKQQNEVVIAATTDPHKGVNTSKKRPDGNISSVKVREKLDPVAYISIFINKKNMVL